MSYIGFKYILTYLGEVVRFLGLLILGPLQLMMELVSVHVHVHVEGETIVNCNRICTHSTRVCTMYALQQI